MVSKSAPHSHLEVLAALEQKGATKSWDIPQEVVARVQAEAIRSVNALWGVFSRSRVFFFFTSIVGVRRVNAGWPARWLVADDVGLGKTARSGHDSLAAFSARSGARVLSDLPIWIGGTVAVSLAHDGYIRLAIYTPDSDTPRADFWNVHDGVVASLQTLRMDHKNRHKKRLLESRAWDMLMVDEAHHLGASQNKAAGLSSRQKTP